MQIGILMESTSALNPAAIAREERSLSSLGQSIIHRNLGCSMQSQRPDKQKGKASVCHPDSESGPSQDKSSLSKLFKKERAEYLAIEGSTRGNGTASAAKQINSVSRTLEGSSSNSILPTSSRPSVALQANDGRSLFEFDVPANAATIERFHKIATPICLSLKEYVKKKPIVRLVEKLPLQQQDVSSRDRAMAVRLMMLGETKSEAKPYIVVLSAEHQCKLVRKFFEKTTVRSLIEPSDKSLPSFEYVIHKHPPEPKQAEDNEIYVLAPVEDDVFAKGTGTLCGTPIIIQHPSASETRATLGGIIKVVNESGTSKLYGLTAGHVVRGLNDGSQASSSSIKSTVSNYLALSDSESDFDSDCESNFLEDANEELLSDDQGTELWLNSGPWSSGLGEIGAISRFSPQLGQGTARTAASAPDYDWALIEMLVYKPNHLSAQSTSSSKDIRATSTESNILMMPTSNYMGTSIPVAVISGSEGLKRGMLSALPSKLTLGSSATFVDAMIIKLDAGKGKSSRPTFIVVS